MLYGFIIVMEIVLIVLILFQTSVRTGIIKDSLESEQIRRVGLMLFLH